MINQLISIPNTVGDFLLNPFKSMSLSFTKTISSIFNGESYVLNGHLLHNLAPASTTNLDLAPLEGQGSRLISKFIPGILPLILD